MKLKKWDRVEITWLDAHTEDDWTFEDDFKSSLAKVTSIGYYLEHDDNHFSIASSRSEDSMFSILTVPQKNVVFVTKYKQPTK